MIEDLIGFLTARYAELENGAQAAGGGTWEQVDPDREPGRIVDDRGDTVTYDESNPDKDQAAHIAAWNPAHVLGDIAARRKLLAWAVDYDYYQLNPIRADRLVNSEWGNGDIDAPELTEQLLKLLAEPFSWHPDYRDREWKP
jgi:hypothetical protein